ncbi:hypothetical protein V6N12_004021 [Hibiscus sabdariffa]|uniref:RNase H type-1 domain-containing protein n=1 Tax=Hibiscus sabdariffa TaxID=183260 RepID=A0ABR2CK75_9ROSI
MTHVERCRRSLATNPYCLECNSSAETALHALRDCPAVRTLWLCILPAPLVHSLFSLNLQDWLSCSLSSAFLHPRWKISWQFLFVSLIWQIWKRRNDVVFHNPCLSDSALINRSLAWAKHYFDSVVRQLASPSVSRPVWNPRASLGSGWTYLNVDGAVSVPSHESRIGGLIRSSAGDWIVGFAKAIGRSDVLQAELWAIFEGISLAWEYGFDRLLIHSDSKQAVELVNSTTAVSSGLSLVRAIYRLRQLHWNTEVIWVSRDENHHADALAKLVSLFDFPCRYMILRLWS